VKKKRDKTKKNPKGRRDEGKKFKDKEKEKEITEIKGI
jgi:hypothetical protein